MIEEGVMKAIFKACLTCGSLILLIVSACSPTSTPTPTQIPPTSSPVPASLTEYGQYDVGMRTFSATDANRDDRQVNITVWYPALPSSNSMMGMARKDAEPDHSAEPYPLILSSTKVAEILAPRLVSHGFTWASVDRIDAYMGFYKGAIDQPLDILFALNQVAANPPEGLDGMTDDQQAGTIGYSFDGFNSLAMSGARVDPGYYLAQCPTPDATTAAILGGLSAFSCVPARDWQSFTAQFGEAFTASADGLWQPLTDERIRAVMPMAAEGWWLFGERGLAAVDRPVLIIDGTHDELYQENALIFEHLGTSDKAFISFIGKDHMMIYEQDSIARMAQFAVAFFGYHLQSRQDLVTYFSEDYVSHQEGLAWGVYTGD
jgi:predicted dienelactone hydrolase